MRKLSQTARRIGALAALAFGCAAPALALTPLVPYCAPEQLAPEEANLGGYNYYNVGNGFVRYDSEAAGGNLWVTVIEHCPSRERVSAMLAMDDPKIGAVRARLDDAINSSRTYSLRQIARLLQRAGAPEARQSRVGFTSCACAEFYPAG